MFKKTVSKKQKMLLLSLVAVLVLGVGGTLAYIIVKTGAVSNAFNPSRVECEVNEDLDKISNSKKNVVIGNTGTIDAYIRAEIVVSWQSEDGTVYGKKPVKDVDYEITYGEEDKTLRESGWIEAEDGYYYYESIVAPENLTKILVRECKLKDGATAPDGYALCVEILAEAVQADGVTENGTPAVVDAWGVTYNEETKTISK